MTNRTYKFLNILWVLLLLLSTSAKEFDRQYYIDHAIIPVSKLIALEGYPEETFQIRTEDGVVLELHRIPHGKNRTESDVSKKPILLLHGIMMSAYYWIIHPKVSLAYMLADRGYDVWMGNFRGQSQFETTRTFTKTLGPKGWRFTQDDLALYDVPAFIDTILEKTGKTSIHIIGFSLGNTTPFQLLSAKVEYNEKVASLTALGPSVYVEKNTGPARFFNKVPLGKLMLKAAAAASGYGAVRGSGLALHLVVLAFCERYGFQQKWCKFVSGIQVGMDPDISKELLKDFFNRVTPVPSLVLMQYQQAADTGRFAHFDYGWKKNFAKYGARKPPLYDLRNVKTKVAVVDGPTDAFNTRKNAKYLERHLDRSLYTYYRVKDVFFSHISFILAKDVDRRVYHYVFDFLDKVK